MLEIDEQSNGLEKTNNNSNNDDDDGKSLFIGKLIETPFTQTEFDSEFYFKNCYTFMFRIHE